MKFVEKLVQASRQQHSLLCVGLDPEPGRLPASFQALSREEAVVRFCQQIIEVTAPFVCAFKPNIAFFEALGPGGMSVFQHVCHAVPSHIPIIVDAKRGDLGNTSRYYATALFDIYGCDAITVNPYLGYDSVAPFLEYADKGTILLCRTSNPSARDLQDLPIQCEDGQQRPLYEVVAQRIQSWNTAGNCGLVVGATYPQELQTIRSLCPDLPILIPGVGAQGGDLEVSIQAGVDAHGERAILAVSRSILYASSDEDFALAAQREAQNLCNRINAARAVK